MIEYGILIFKAYAVPILAASCVPLVSMILYLLRGRVGLKLGQCIAASLGFVAFGLSSLIVFGMLHDGRLYPDSTYQHQGLIFFTPLALFIYSKLAHKDWRNLFDVFAVVLPFVVAGIRLYCISQGCCYGRSFFGMGFDWPVREITIVLNGLCGIAMFRAINKEHAPGILMAVYLMIYSIIRFEEVALWGDIYRDAHFLDRGLAIFSFSSGLLLYLKMSTSQDTGDSVSRVA